MGTLYWIYSSVFSRQHRLEKISVSACPNKLKREADQYSSVYLTPDSLDQAKTAAASLCKLVSKVLQGDVDNGFAIIRPPGHHAEPGMAGGFCLINNVAVAADYALQHHVGVERVLIVDYDIHHGNGTEQIFVNNPHVLCISIHSYLRRQIFPFQASGSPRHVGAGSGTGFTVNIGWSRTGMGNEEYAAAFQSIVMPVAREFQPDLVLVSAGFDGALGDLHDGGLSPKGFASMTRDLMTLGPVVCTLEGGYVLSVLGECVSAVVQTLLDRNSVTAAADEKQTDNKDILASIDPVAAKDIQATKQAHRPYWKCLQEADE